MSRKLYVTLEKFILVVVIASLMYWGLPLSTFSSSSLTMLSISDGQVLVLKAGTATWISGKVGMTLEAGDSIKTDDSSNATITFFDGSTIELRAGTVLDIVTLKSGTVGDSSTIIKLKQGIGNTISRITKLADPASSYEVETPSGVGVVRGSIMIVTVDNSQYTIVGNFEGDVCFRAAGRTVCPGPGYQTSANQNQPPSAPVPLSSFLSGLARGAYK